MHWPPCFGLHRQVWFFSLSLVMRAPRLSFTTQVVFKILKLLLQCTLKILPWSQANLICCMPEGKVAKWIVGFLLISVISWQWSCVGIHCHQAGGRLWPLQCSLTVSGFTNTHTRRRRAINPINCLIPGTTNAIFCYKCESYRDYRCLDPFDPRPHIQVNCDMEHFVRDKKPVFCEKVTELSKSIAAGKK